MKYYLNDDKICFTLKNVSVDAKLFQGVVALVTGGASGLGRGAVDRLVQSGAKVLLCDLPNSNGSEVSKTIGEDKVIFAPVNVGDLNRYTTFFVIDFIEGH